MVLYKDDEKVSSMETEKIMVGAYNTDHGRDTTFRPTTSFFFTAGRSARMWLHRLPVHPVFILGSALTLPTATVYRHPF